MEWCWDGEKCLQFHQWNDVAIAHFASENLGSLRKSKMCRVCHVQKRESWLSATCWRSFDLQLVFFLRLASGCNLECACRECLAKNEVSPAPPRMLTPPQKRLYKEVSDFVGILGILSILYTLKTRHVATTLHISGDRWQYNISQHSLSLLSKRSNLLSSKLATWSRATKCLQTLAKQIPTPQTKRTTLMNMFNRLKPRHALV